jgi:uncharacterized membrane protein YbhN (UPF0104 family)
VCFRARRRAWTIRRQRIVLPSGRVALWQLGVSAGNWALIGAVMYVLMQHHVAYLGVLGVLLVAAIAGVITHVPAGLGVIEAVFVALLGQHVPQAELIAALLAYRALYYLAPLAVAAIVLIGIESRASTDTGCSDRRRPIGASSYTPQARAADHESAREDERHVTSGGQA